MCECAVLAGVNTAVDAGNTSHFVTGNYWEWCLLTADCMVRIVDSGDYRGAGGGEVTRVLITRHRTGETQTEC